MTTTTKKEQNEMMDYTDLLSPHWSKTVTSHSDKNTTKKDTKKGYWIRPSQKGSLDSKLPLRESNVVSKSHSAAEVKTEMKSLETDLWLLAVENSFLIYTQGCILRGAKEKQDDEHYFLEEIDKDVYVKFGIACSKQFKSVSKNKRTHDSLLSFCLNPTYGHMENIGLLKGLIYSLEISEDSNLVEYLERCM